MKNIVLITILLSGLTGCGHATTATQGAGIYSQGCSPHAAAAAQAALNPAYGHNEGIAGAIAKGLMGIEGGGACGGNLQPTAQPHQPVSNSSGSIYQPTINPSITCFDMGEFTTCQNSVGQSVTCMRTGSFVSCS
jgi:hypothetical protein